jgi:GT2 family glycosyltransferase
MQPEPIDILLTTYFRFDFTRKVIEHIMDRTRSDSYRLIIVDNGSTDGTREYLQNLKHHNPNQVVIKLLQKNFGLQVAKNIGMEYVQSSLFVNTDNDCLCPQLTPDWLTQLTQLIEARPDYAAISLRPQILVGVGPIFSVDQDVIENNVAGGSFRIMRTNLVREVGMWQDSFENRQEEWNICTKLRNAGYKVGYAKHLFCYHMFGPGENWGYSEGIEHYHNPASKIYARDTEYDPITCEPKIHSNE